MVIGTRDAGDLESESRERDAWNGVGKAFAPGERVHMPDLGNPAADFGLFEGTVGESPIYARIRWGGEVHEYPIRYVQRVPERRGPDCTLVALALVATAACAWMALTR